MVEKIKIWDEDPFAWEGMSEREHYILDTF